MKTRHIVLVLVAGVLLARGVGGLHNGEIGTVVRQAAIGLIVFTFGIALAARWDKVG